MAGKWWRDGSCWAAVAGGAIAFPIGVLLHELGHFGGFAAFGFRDPVLHFASAGWADGGQFDSLFRAGDVEAAAAIAPPWQVAVAIAAGPIVSYLTVFACILALRRSGPGPLSLVLGVGLTTPFHWTWSFAILFLILRGDRVTWGPDEIQVAAITGIPQFLVILLALASALLAYWFVVTAIPRGQRVRTIVPTLVGAAVVGGPVWVLWVGPWLLP